ncbi:sensor domain-containing protein [Herbiconiux sp. L3-i23]|uniref:sensor domain-containing protein n=1 Tax=Herbiconiux sp. L3-i23 TaxID=2905871 RepID=UPI00206DDA8F|nr:sensor domain-containing protein [Herbiconiux sp. L3-i23]BDI23294.1 hypothetical protein L3i23_20700 [Herbiconiux sp. L3-i23]
MTTATSVLPRRRSTTASPLRLAGAIAQLAALGLVGPLVLTVVLTLFSVGLGLLPVLGIGVVFLIAFIYSLFAVGWLETARVDGLYDLGLPALRPRPRPDPGPAGCCTSSGIRRSTPPCGGRSRTP